MCLVCQHERSGSVFKQNEATIEGVFRGRRVFICLVDNGDGGGVSRGSQMRRSS